MCTCTYTYTKFTYIHTQKYKNGTDTHRMCVVVVWTWCCCLSFYLSLFFPLCVWIWSTHVWKQATKHAHVQSHCMWPNSENTKKIECFWWFPRRQNSNSNLLSFAPTPKYKERFSRHRNEFSPEFSLTLPRWCMIHFLSGGSSYHHRRIKQLSRSRNVHRHTLTYAHKNIYTHIQIY